MYMVQTSCYLHITYKLEGQLSTSVIFIQSWKKHPPSRIIHTRKQSSILWGPVPIFLFWILSSSLIKKPCKI